MTELSQKNIQKQINDLFRQASDEEKKYNWNYVIEKLKNAEKISIDKKIKVLEAETYFKLGDIYQLIALTGKEKVNVLSNFQLAIEYFHKSHNLFKELGTKEKINASLGYINLIEYLIGSKVGKEQILLESAINNLKNAKEIFQRNGNYIDSLKTTILESRARVSLLGESLFRIDEKADFKKLAENCEDLITKIWEELKNQQEFPESYLCHFLNSIIEYVNWSFTNLPTENSKRKKILFDNLNRVEEFIEKFGDLDLPITKFVAYAILACINAIIAAFIVDNQFEQKKYLKFAQKWLKKGKPLLENKELPVPSLILYYYIQFTITIYLTSLGFFAKDFKYVMEDFNKLFELLDVFFPKIMVLQILFMASIIFVTGGLEQSIPDKQRIDFVERGLSIMELVNDVLSKEPDLNYKMLELQRDMSYCLFYALLGDLVKDQEKSSYIQKSAKFFNELKDYSNPRISYSYFYYNYLNFYSRAGTLLAKNSKSLSEKISYLLKVIDFLVECNKRRYVLFYIDNMFLLGNTYYEVGRLTNDDKLFKNAYASYTNTIDYCRNKGYYNLVGSGYINLAQIEDRLGNFLSAAQNYEMAVNSFDQAFMTLTYSKLGKKIEKLKSYVNAWNLIEIAKSYHTREDHINAQLNYEKACEILGKIREYRYESSFYSAWAVLEEAENLSKKGKHQDSANKYQESRSNFEKAIENLNSYLGKRKSPEDQEKISKLIQVAEIRERYCTARQNIETARLEGKKGNHLFAAELYNKSSILFENLCQKFRIKREKDELTAIFNLCKAWEYMEQAEGEQNPSLYAKASEVFEKSSNIFPESRMKKLSIGNSLYCSALECGFLFDNSSDLEEKINFYKKIKMYLRESSKNYQLGGFEQDAKWALATSTFFDGIWHLIQSDNETEFSKKDQYLKMGINYFNSALEIFEKAGYEQKREEILNYIKMIEEEKEILTSVLSVIEKPAISASSIGISAPSCPVEISSSVNIGEMQQTDLQTESELNWQKRIHSIYIFMPNGTCIYDHPFKSEEEVEPQLISGGLTGISMLIQEVTKNKTKVKIVEQEEMTILLEHGKYLSVALITEENLMTLRNKLEKLVKEVEEFYEEDLENYSGNISIFSKVGKFIQKIFAESA
ncbi:MAG: hypothetical protein ACFFDN_05400 [Candidatus Hodarchaeota archaeon]